MNERKQEDEFIMSSEEMISVGSVMSLKWMFEELSA